MTTGGSDIICGRHMSVMEDDAIVCNIGHSDVEIDAVRLKKSAVDRFQVESGNHIILLAEGRIVNLACATGHLSSDMSKSFSCQALTQVTLWIDAASYPVGVNRPPKALVEEAAASHLQKIGAKLTNLNRAQYKYLDVGPKALSSQSTTATN
ncbi:S-adenosyl-L-homocysteine hydrolase [Mortierella antarctica]|nr:S-adenosyl-L-homocysteine hydrolase [Mortierella antarctica]